MQSGSGLAHWSINYERHLISIADNTKPEDQTMLKNLMQKTRYVNSINDTMVNYLCITSCNLTNKYRCLKNNLLQYGEWLRNHMESSYLNGEDSQNVLREENLDHLVREFLDSLKEVEEGTEANNKRKQAAFKLSIKLLEAYMKVALDTAILKVSNIDDLSTFFKIIYPPHFDRSVSLILKSMLCLRFTIQFYIPCSFLQTAQITCQQLDIKR